VPTFWSSPGSIRIRIGNAWKNEEAATDFRVTFSVSHVPPSWLSSFPFSKLDLAVHVLSVSSNLFFLHVLGAPEWIWDVDWKVFFNTWPSAAVVKTVVPDIQMKKGFFRTCDRFETLAFFLPFSQGHWETHNYSLSSRFEIHRKASWTRAARNTAVGNILKKVFFTLKTQKNKNEAECGRSLLFLAPDKVGSLQTACLSRTFFFKSCGELTFAVDTTREEVKSWEIVLEFTVGGSRREKFLEFQTMLRSL